MSKPTTYNLQPTTFLKIFFGLLLVVGCWSLVDVGNVLAQEEECVSGSGEYCLLAPIPLEGANSNTTKAKLSTYIQGLFMLTIGIATALAVIYIIIGGIQYISSEVFTSKAAAKTTITNALVGLLMAISAWMILYTVNPKLLNFDLKIDPIEIVKETTTPGTTPGTPSPGGGGGVRPGYNLTPEQVAQDNAIEKDLLNHSPKIKINNDPCTTGGTSGCTNVVGLPPGAISGVKNLASSCQSTSGRDCIVEITGGTEGGHVTHGPNIANVDLGKNMNLDKYIRQNGTSSNASCGIKSAPKYSLNGAIYTDEGDHWHACY